MLSLVEIFCHCHFDWQTAVNWQLLLILLSAFSSIFQSVSTFQDKLHHTYTVYCTRHWNLKLVRISNDDSQTEDFYSNNDHKSNSFSNHAPRNVLPDHLSSVVLSLKLDLMSGQSDHFIYIWIFSSAVFIFPKLSETAPLWVVTLGQCQSVCVAKPDIAPLSTPRPQVKLLNF